MEIDFREIGRRLTAYRLGRKLPAEDVANILGISRAAVYRLEKGDIVKIQTVSAVAKLPDVSLPSVIGVGVEYYSNSLAFFERMRQLETQSTFTLGNFSPVSLLLLSDEYMTFLKLMLAETISEDNVDKQATLDYVDNIFGVLCERRKVMKERRIPGVNIPSKRDIEDFLRFGLVGRFDLPIAVQRERRNAAIREIHRICAMFEHPPLGLQIGVVDSMPSSQTFQIFERAEGSVVSLSPYRLGHHLYGHTNPSLGSVPERQRRRDHPQTNLETVCRRSRSHLNFITPMNGSQKSDLMP